MGIKKPLLSVHSLEKSYKGRKVVNQLSFEVYEGEIVGLLGPNGAGKTTAFYITMGLIRPDKGEVIFKNKKLAHLSMSRRAQMGMGYLSQEPTVFGSLTVADNILCILETLNLSKKEKFKRLDQLLGELHLNDLANNKAATLSGGQRRRLEITRAMITRPSLLLLDEPFANIDPIAVSDVKNMIRHLVKKKISVLITDHNAREIFSIVDRSYLITDGSVLLSGTVEELVKHPSAQKVYLGSDFKL